MSSKLEHDYAEDIDKRSFFEMLKKENIDLDMVSDRKKDQNENFHKFNILINRLYYDGKLEVKNAAIFLYKDYFDTFDQVLCCFDEFNLYILKYEMANNHHKKINRNSLENFMLA